MRAAWLLALAGLLAEQGRTVVGQEDYKLSDHDLRSELGLPQDYEKNAVRDAAAKSFKSMDEDFDGKLTISEFEQYPKTLVYEQLTASGVVKNIHYQTAFAHADDNFDLLLSSDEFVEWAHNTLASADNIAYTWKFADTDGDGVLTFDEYHEALGADDKEVSMKDFKILSRGKETATKDDFERYHSPDDFGAADLNGDHVLDMHEWTTATFHFLDHDHSRDAAKVEVLKKTFKEYDKDGDNKINAVEFNTLHHKEASLPHEVLTDVHGMKIEDFDLPSEIDEQMKLGEFDSEMMDDL